MPCWYYTKKQLLEAPSFQDGLPASLQMRYRREGSSLIIDIGQRLGLNFLTFSTGVVYFHRFYQFHSFREFNRFVTATCCLFLAGKVEETPKKCKDVVKMAKTLLTAQQFAAFGEDPKEEVMTLERILLQTIKFDLQVDLPFPYLFKFGKQLTQMGHSGDQARLNPVMQKAYDLLVNECLVGTTLCLQWEPDILAVAIIYLAVQFEHFDMKNISAKCHKKWWEMLVEDTTRELLEDICHQLLDMYPMKKSCYKVKADSPPPPPPPPPKPSANANKRPRQVSPADMMKEAKPNNSHGPDKSRTNHGGDTNATSGRKSLPHTPTKREDGLMGRGSLGPSPENLPGSLPGSRSSSPAVKNRKLQSREAFNSPMKTGQLRPGADSSDKHSNGNIDAHKAVGMMDYSPSQDELYNTENPPTSVPVAAVVGVMQPQQLPPRGVPPLRPPVNHQLPRPSSVDGPQPVPPPSTPPKYPPPPSTAPPQFAPTPGFVPHHGQSLPFPPVNTTQPPPQPVQPPEGYYQQGHKDDYRNSTPSAVRPPPPGVPPGMPPGVPPPHPVPTTQHPAHPTPPNLMSLQVHPVVPQHGHVPNQPPPPVTNAVAPPPQPVQPRASSQYYDPSSHHYDGYSQQYPSQNASTQPQHHQPPAPPSEPPQERTSMLRPAYMQQPPPQQQPQQQPPPQQQQVVRASLHEMPYPPTPQPVHQDGPHQRRMPPSPPPPPLEHRERPVRSPPPHAYRPYSAPPGHHGAYPHPPPEPGYDRYPPYNAPTTSAGHQPPYPPREASHQRYPPAPSPQPHPRPDTEAPHSRQAPHHDTQLPHPGYRPGLTRDAEQDYPYQRPSPGPERPPHHHQSQDYGPSSYGRQPPSSQYPPTTQYNPQSYDYSRPTHPPPPHPRTPPPPGGAPPYYGDQYRAPPPSGYPQDYMPRR